MWANVILTLFLIPRKPNSFTFSIYFSGLYLTVVFVRTVNMLMNEITVVKVLKLDLCTTKKLNNQFG